MTNLTPTRRVLESPHHPPSPRWALPLVVAGALLVVWFGDLVLLAIVGYLPAIVWLLIVGRGDELPHLPLALLLRAVAVAAGTVLVSLGARQLVRRPARPRASSLRLGRRWVAVAVVVPLIYTLTRYAWFAGVPLGVSRQMLTTIEVSSGFMLGTGALVGSVLTTGLVARWGELWWRWVPGLGGKPIPVALAVVPATIVAALVTGAGVSFWKLALTGRLSEVPGEVSDVAAWLPEMFWPIWGVSLAGATWCYWRRRTADAVADAPPLGGESAR